MHACGVHDSIGRTAANLHEIGVTGALDGVTPLIAMESPAHDLVSIVTSMLFACTAGAVQRRSRARPHVIHGSFCPNTSDQQDFVLARRLANRAGLHLDMVERQWISEFSAGFNSSTSKVALVRFRGRERLESVQRAELRGRSEFRE